jgi:hypothetical protein
MQTLAPPQRSRTVAKLDEAAAILGAPQNAAGLPARSSRRLTAARYLTASPPRIRLQPQRNSLLPELAQAQSEKHPYLKKDAGVV